MARPAIAISIVLMITSPVLAQNLLFNPGFDTADQLDGWTCTSSDGLASWSSEDRSGSPVSGSMQHDVDGAANNARIWCHQCVPVTELEGYVFSTWHYWPDDPDVDQIGSTRLSVNFYTEAGCSSLIEVGPTKTVTPASLDTWYLFESDEQIAPTGALSATANVFTWQNLVGQPVRARLDDLDFSTATLFRDGFESGGIGCAGPTHLRHRTPSPRNPR